MNDPPKADPKSSYDHGFLKIAAVILNNHPLPWTIERDWTCEVHASDGAIVAKCDRNKEEKAENIISCAKRLSNNQTIPISLIHSLDDLVFEVFIHHKPPWEYDSETGNLFASDGVLIAANLSDGCARALCYWAQEMQYKLSNFNT